MITFLMLSFTAIAVLLILVVMVQRGRGGGLAGAFGSGGGGGSAFGTKTGDVFTWVTVILFVVFMLMAVGLNFAFKGSKEEIQGMPTSEPAVSVPLGAGSATQISAPAPAISTTLPSSMPAVRVEPVAPASAPAH